MDTKKEKEVEGIEQKENNDNDDKVYETDVLKILRSINISSAEDDKFFFEGSLGCGLGIESRIGLRRNTSKDRLFNDCRGIPHDLPEEYFW